MRLIDADALKGKLPEPNTAKQIWVYQTLCDFIDNAPTVCGNTPKWCESCVSKGKCASTRTHIIDNCDMNVFEPEKKIETPSCLTNPERQEELLKRYKEGEYGES